MGIYEILGQNKLPVLTPFVVGPDMVYSNKACWELADHYIMYTITHILCPANLSLFYENNVTTDHRNDMHF